VKHKSFAKVSPKLIVYFTRNHVGNKVLKVSAVKTCFFLFQAPSTILQWPLVSK